MTNVLVILRKVPCVWALLLVLLPNIAHATLSSCGGAAITSFSATNNPPSGCGSGDLGFSAFAATNASSITLMLDTPPAVPTGTSMPQIGNEFDSSQWFLTTRKTVSFNVSYQTQVIGGDGSGSEGYSPPAPYATWAITAFEFGLGANVFDTPADIATAAEYFCLQTSAACTIATSNGYIQEVLTGTGNAATPQSFTWIVCTPNANLVGCNASPSRSPFVFLPDPVTQITFFTTVTETEGGQSIDISLGNEFIQDVETPEPSTFLLISAAMLGMKITLARRRASR